MDMHAPLALLKGARNGIVYGAKVRFPHALVMTLLFSRAPPRIAIARIFAAVKTHSLNLAKYVTLYKLGLLIQRALNAGVERSVDPFFAGLLGGYVVFGDRNPVNEQIVMYVVSRVITSFLPRDPTVRQSFHKMPTAPVPPDAPYPHHRPPHPFYFRLYSAITWAAVMYLFKHHRERLQPGMVNSMQYLYLDSEVWSGLDTLLWRQ